MRYYYTITRLAKIRKTNDIKNVHTLDHQLTSYTKINSRWIKELNVSCNTIKVPEENIGRKISDIPHSNTFTDMSPRARDIM